MRADELDFYLPAELIAQSPATQRTDSRLLHYKKHNGSTTHQKFRELTEMLTAGDLLVFNDAKVIPARFTLQKITGGRVEGLFLSEIETGRWQVMLKGAGNASKLFFQDDKSIDVNVLKALGDGAYEIVVNSYQSPQALLDRLGRMPLPPYIRREKDFDARDDKDKKDYQTVFAKTSGSVAAPTAGLHFSNELLQELDAQGIDQTHITLHVGMGTFKPVTADSLESHVMHSERFEISAQAATALNLAQAEGRRIVAVGTTACRVLESYPDAPWEPTSGETSIFIYPPYKWKRVGALVTNFHLPRSTLIALVAAMVGLEEQRRIYAEAIQNKYRFFSYGDAMFIE